MRSDKGAWQDAQVSVGGNPPFLNQAEFDDGGPYQNSLQQRNLAV